MFVASLDVGSQAKANANANGKCQPGYLHNMQAVGRDVESVANGNWDTGTVADHASSTSSSSSMSRRRRRRRRQRRVRTGRWSHLVPNTSVLTLCIFHHQEKIEHQTQHQMAG